MPPRRRPTTARSIVDELKSAYVGLREDVRARWRRDLPFSELVFDRWERAASLGFGAGASIYHDSYVYGDVTVGEVQFGFEISGTNGSAAFTDNSFAITSA